MTDNCFHCCSPCPPVERSRSVASKLSCVLKIQQSVTSTQLRKPSLRRIDSKDHSKPTGARECRTTSGSLRFIEIGIEEIVPLHGLVALLGRPVVHQVGFSRNPI